MLHQTIRLYNSYKFDSMEVGISYYNIEFINEDNINFAIRCFNNKSKYLCYFNISDYFNNMDWDFIEKVNNFEKLKEILNISISKKKARLCKVSDSFLFAVHYPIIYENKYIIFELHKELSNFEEKKIIGLNYKHAKNLIEEVDNKINNYFKFEKIKIENIFEEFEDRYKMKVILKNIGTAPWPKKISSLKCVPRLSSVLCEDYIFDEDIMPEREIEVNLEIFKLIKNAKGPYLTVLQLNISPNKYGQLLVIDTRNLFNKDKITPNENIELNHNPIENKKDILNKPNNKFIINKNYEEEQKNHEDLGKKNKNNAIKKENNITNNTNTNPIPKLSFAQRIAMFDKKKNP